MISKISSRVGATRIFVVRPNGGGNPTPTPIASNTPTPTPTNTPTSTPIVYYYYYLRDCNHTHNKIGRSLTSGLGGITYSVGNGVCYEIVGIDPGPTFDYDLDTITIVSDCNNAVCLTPTPTPTSTPIATSTPTPTPTITLSPYNYTIQCRSIDGSNNKYGWSIQQDACQGSENNIIVYSNSSTFVDGMNFYSDTNGGNINNIVAWTEYYYYYPLENKSFRWLDGGTIGEILICVSPTETPTPTPTSTETSTPLPTETPTPTPTPFIPDNDFTYVIIPNNDLSYTLIPSNDLVYLLIPNDDLTYTLIPTNDLTHTLIPNNDLLFTLVPDGNLTYVLLPDNDFNEITIPDNDLTNVLIPNNDLTDTLIPDNDLNDVLIPDNDILPILIPNSDITYTLIPNTDFTYTLIPNNDVEYTVLKPPTVFYGQVKLGEDSVEGTCNCPENECPRFYVTGDGPTFCESNILISDEFINFNGWGTIVYDGYYKTINMNGSNIATYRTDCGSCPTTPTPTPTPTPTMIPYNKIVDLNVNNSIQYSGIGTTIQDLLEGTTGTIVGNPLYQNDGCTSSITLNGVNQYIITNGSIHTLYDSADTSVFLWVYLTDNGVILSEQGVNDLNTSWHDSQIEMVSGSLKFSVWPYGNTITSSISTPLNNWYYIGFIQNVTTLTAYVNGQSAGSVNVTRDTPYNHNLGLHYAIGAEDSTNLGDGSYSALKFGRLEIWDGAISPSDVSQNYNNSVTTWICPTPTPTSTPTATPTPTATSTPTPTPTSTPTPTPTESPIDFSIGSTCDAGGSYYTFNHTGGSGQYDRSTSENSTESEALTTTQWMNVPNPGSYVTSGVGVPNITKTYWVAVRDRNNPSNIVAKSVIVDCAPTATPTPTPTSTPTPTPTAQPSGLIVTISEVGSDVIMSGSGSLNVTGLIEGSVQSNGGINGTSGTWVIGSSTAFFGRKFYGNIVNVYPNSFGSGYTAPTSYSGDKFGVQIGSISRDIILPLGYTSGSPLSGTATFANKTISNMGLTSGTYTYSWGSDSITLQIGS
jgi:hypothetical protein